MEKRIPYHSSGFGAKYPIGGRFGGRGGRGGRGFPTRPICSNFAKGECQFGSSCRFSHSPPVPLPTQEVTGGLTVGATYSKVSPLELGLGMEGWQAKFDDAKFEAVRVISDGDVTIYGKGCKRNFLYFQAY